MNRVSAINTLQYNEALCIGCGLCVDVCPHGVFALEGRVARLVCPAACMECGACQRNCRYGAIAVRAGVGCAWAIVVGKMKGTAPVC